MSKTSIKSPCVFPRCQPAPLTPLPGEVLQAEPGLHGLCPARRRQGHRRVPVPVQGQEVELQQPAGHPRLPGDCSCPPVSRVAAPAGGPDQAAAGSSPGPRRPGGGQSGSAAAATQQLAVPTGRLHAPVTLLQSLTFLLVRCFF